LCRVLESAADGIPAILTLLEPSATSRHLLLVGRFFQGASLEHIAAVCRSFCFEISLLISQMNLICLKIIKDQ